MRKVKSQRLIPLLFLGLVLFGGNTFAATYVYDDTVPFAWDGGATTNVVWEQRQTNYPIDDDKQLVNIGFTFNFGGTDYTQVRIISNGALHFGANQGFHKDYSNEALPITTTEGGPGPEEPADRVIAPYWDDLDPSSGGTVRYAVLGTAPDRRFVVSWENVPTYSWSCSAWGIGCDSHTFQVILYENGDFKFQYGPGDADGSSATIGAEVDNSDFTQYSFNSSGAVGNGKAILFTVPPPPSPIAYYALEALSWDGTPGEIVDGSGNGNNGTTVGTVTPDTVNPALAGDPGTCGYAEVANNTSDAIQDAIDSGVDVDSMLGNRGTISFWYKSNLSWGGNSGNRQLFDASRGNKYFYLTLLSQPGDNGVLQFGLEDSNDADFLIETGNNNIGAGTWAHIAVTWDLSADMISIYLNGSLAGSTNINSNGTLGNMDTLFFGDNRSSYLPWDSTGNSANGAFDEIRLYDAAQNISQVQADMNATHPCGASLDHYVITHDGFGINCVDEPIQVDAIDSSGNLHDAGGITVTLDTQSGTGTWSLAGGGGAFSDPSPNDGLASYTFAGGESSASFNLSYTEGASPINIAISGGGAVDDDSEGSLSFHPNGFVVTDSEVTDPALLDTTLAPKNSGTTFTLHLTAYGQTPTDPACGIIETYDGAKNLRLWATYDNPAYTTDAPLRIAVDGTGIDKEEDETLTVHPISFSAGKATMVVKYKDVGKVGINLKDTTVTDPVQLPNGIRGGSTLFVVKPASFVLGNIINPVDGPPVDCSIVEVSNPQAADASGAFFAKAGETVCLTVTALDAEGDATPSYGQETAPAETVKLSNTSDPDLTGLPILVAPAGGNNAVLQTVSAFTFNNGTATGQFSWGEVGIIRLTPRVGDGDYLGGGDVIGTTSNNIGRLTPDHFAVATNTPQFATACGGGGFTYIGQSFNYATAPVVTVTAQNGSNGTTQNYTGDFWKITDAVLTASGNKSYTDPHGTLDTSGLGTPDPAIVDNGDGTGSLTFSAGSGLLFNRGTEEAPFDAEIALSMDVIDADGIAYAGNPVSFGAASAGNGIAFDFGKEQRYGRLLLNNAYGSELADLYVPMEVQYYQGSATGFVASTTDLCTSVTVSLNADAVAGDNLDPGETCIWDTGNPATDLSGADACALAAPGGREFREAATLINGDFNLYLAAPGSGNTGSVDISAVLQDGGSYLQYDWDGTGASDPTSRATFGLYRGSDTLIYRRENY